MPQLILPAIRKAVSEWFCVKLYDLENSRNKRQLIEFGCKVTQSTDVYKSVKKEDHIWTDYI